MTTVSDLTMTTGSQTARRSRRHLELVLAVVVALVALLIVPATSSAASCTDNFIGPNEAKWTNAANWSTGRVPDKEDVVCIPAGIRASLWFANNNPGDVFVKQIQGGSVMENTGLYLTGGPGEGPSTLETLVVTGSNIDVEDEGALKITHELFINGYSSAGGHGTIALEPEAVGQLGEVGCGALYVDKTQILNRGTLHVGRKYVGGVAIGLSDGGAILNEGVLLMDSQMNVKERCDAVTGGAMIYRYSPTFPYKNESLINRGTIDTEWGEQAVTIAVPTTNDGDVVAREGSLAFSDGTPPTECSTGTWETDGAPIELSDGVFAIAPGVNLLSVTINPSASVTGCPAPGSGTPLPTSPSPGGSEDELVSKGSSGSSTATTWKTREAPAATSGETKPIALPPTTVDETVDCIVPKIRAGSTLNRVRRLLSSTHCLLGRVYYVTSKEVRSGRVISSRARPGTHLHDYALVAIVVARANSRFVRSAHR
jgi:hypothetical protein